MRPEHTWTRGEMPAPVLALGARPLVVDVVKVGVGEGALLERPGGAAQVAHPEPRERAVVAPAAARVRPAVVAGVVAHAEVGGGLERKSYGVFNQLAMHIWFGVGFSNILLIYFCQNPIGP